jgi:hypothetical protein
MDDVIHAQAGPADDFRTVGFESPKYDLFPSTSWALVIRANSKQIRRRFLPQVEGIYHRWGSVQ